MNRIFLFLGTTLCLAQLCSCTTEADVKHPTVAQQDQLDVQWGLPPRQSKGGAKRLYATPENINLPPSAPEAAAGTPPATLPTTPVPAGSAPAAPVDGNANTLR